MAIEIEKKLFIPCSGCGVITPFFGGIYGRMSDKAHGEDKYWMSHRQDRFDDLKNLNDFERINWVKKYSLIPFYSTYMAINVIYQLVKKDIPFPEGVELYLEENRAAKILFYTRLTLTLLPVVGTIVNGALDIIAQVGLAYKLRGMASLQSKVSIIK